MSIVRSGPTKNYADGWEMAFGGRNAGKKKIAAVAVKKKVAKKKAGKKKR